MKYLKLIGLSMVCFVVYAVDIVPNPSSPGNLGSSTNRFPNVYATNIYGNVLTAQFTDFALTGTSVNISPTNGNLQSWVMSGASTAAMDAANTNFTESVRLNIYGSNTLTWTITYLSNSMYLYPTAGVSVLLFDHPRGTNLWRGYRLQ